MYQKFTTLVLCISVLASCKNLRLSESFTVTKTGFIASSHIYDIKVSVLRIDSFDSQKRPAKYSFENIYGARQKGYHSSPPIRKDSLIFDTLQAIDKYNFEFKPQKKIDFFKPNKYYYWSKVSSNDNDDYIGEYEVLPFQLEKDRWYMLRFIEASTEYTILFTLNKNDEIKQFHNHIPGPF
jgi:hypothetical protein